MAIRSRTAQDERLSDIHQQLVAAVDDLVSTDAWMRTLRIAARFPSYSPSNLLLIATQRPDATRVAGIRTWNSLGRRVIRGEHGIAILAPCVYKRSDDGAAPTATPTAERPHQPHDAASGDQDGAEPRVLRGFKLVHVFDVSQTEGDPLPETGPALLAGDAPDHLWDHLADLVSDAGYRLDGDACPPGIQGYTDPGACCVRVRDDVSPAQAVKTLAHELAHIRADHFARFPDYAVHLRCRGQAEIEAESIAYIVTTHAGMDTRAYTVPYVAGWAQGDPGLVRECLGRVVSTASALLLVEASATAVRQIEPSPPVFSRERHGFTITDPERLGAPVS